MSSSRSLPRELLHLAWPVLIAQAAVMATSVIDTLMAGRLSALDLAAVGIGASIYATVFVTAMGVLLALTPVVAHHYGAGRYTEIGADVRQCAWLAVLLSVATFTLLKNPDPLLAISRLTPEVEVRVRAYLDGVAWAAPGVLFFRVFFGFTTGIGRPRPVMAFNLLGLSLKVPLNAVFMYGHFGLPALGGAGCGWSTAVTAWIMTLAAWWWCRRDADYAPYAVFTRFDPPRPAALRELLKLGLPMGITFLVDVTAFTFMALFIARLGAATSAAHQIAANVAVFVFMVPLSLGNATGVLVGQALGAGESRRARHAGLLGLGVAIAIAAATGSVIWFGAGALARGYTTDTAVACRRDQPARHRRAVSRGRCGTGGDGPGAARLQTRHGTDGDLCRGLVGRRAGRRLPAGAHRRPRPRAWRRRLLDGGGGQPDAGRRGGDGLFPVDIASDHADACRHHEIASALAQGHPDRTRQPGQAQPAGRRAQRATTSK
jgi:MATE family multidrug resistance protein